MSGFPQHPNYTGLNAPLGEEYAIFDLAVSGTIPVARVSIPKRLRPQIHGWWVSAAQFAQAA